MLRGQENIFQARYIHYDTMARNDDLLDTIIFAVKYAFSNVESLLIGGIVLALSIIGIGLPFFLGYVTRCIREVEAGNGVLPGWDRMVDMLGDGLKMTVVFLAYLIVYLVIVTILAIPVAIVTIMQVPYLDIVCTIAFAMAAVLITSLWGILMFASWLVYASTRRVRYAMNPKRVSRLVMSNSLGYLIAVTASLAVVVIGTIPMLLFVTIPWAAFLICMAVTFIHAKYYQNTSKTLNEPLLRSHS